MNAKYNTPKQRDKIWIYRCFEERNFIYFISLSHSIRYGCFFARFSLLKIFIETKIDILKQIECKIASERLHYQQWPSKNIPTDPKWQSDSQLELLYLFLLDALGSLRIDENVNETNSSALAHAHTHSRTYKSWDSTVAPLILFSTRAYYLCDNAWKLLHLNKFQCDALQLYLLPLAVRRIFSSFTSWIHKCWEFIVHWVCVCVRCLLRLLWNLF